MGHGNSELFKNHSPILENADAMKQKKPGLRVHIAGVGLANPVMTASGTFGYGEEFKDLMDLGRLGAIVVKGLSLKPEKGNPPPRIVETAGGMLNSIGLENVGVEAFIEKKMPFLRTVPSPVVVNIYGKTFEEYALLAEILDKVEGISFLEVNISCPNVKAGGMAFGTDPESAGRVVASVRKRTSLPVIVKLSPNVSRITPIAKRAEAEGADALCLINTLSGMAIDIRTRSPRLGAVTGGLSGPAIKPVALKMVWEASGAVDIPVIGSGGVMTAEDAIEFLMAGASAVQVGSAHFINPRAAADIIDGIEKFLAEEGIGDVGALIGALEIPGTGPRPRTAQAPV
ncbi:Dihydroorotate dehydrogenase B (NAD(+)), catalytic subunit [Candidatus Desulfarcum epimagneticum]|uniref:Dihydroorotate dehydrogenase n=1 Tax=uncultured Desulfobacteraceae bacterium TaxID=218296 RepID=A0A484HLI5_9BACT|nr:Dihydroorotate dehydrogenase B (NAD(+)), catalytic subunit [uncultured Desulfobacteraceae bacterium]